jgi:hypothetical protein
MTTTKTVQARMTTKGLRIFLEGSYLDSVGFHHRTSYNIVMDNDAVYITINGMGKRTVSGNTSRPVIDMQSKALSTVFNEGMVNVDLSYAEGIIITQGE